MTDPATPDTTSQAAPAAPVAPAAKSPVLSIISLVTGIIGLLGSISGFTLLFSIAAIVLGHMGQKKEPAGKGMWITGLITGYLGALVNVVILATLLIGLIAFSAAVSTVPGT